MLSREEYVDICGTCTKRQFNMKQGIICSLTGEHADFEEECPDYEEDELAARKQKIEQEEKEDEKLASQTLGMSRIGIKNKTVAGVVLIVLGLGWLIGGLSMGRLFFYPIFMIIGGLVVMISGLIAGAKEMEQQQRKSSSEILDDKDDLEVI